MSKINLKSKLLIVLLIVFLIFNFITSSVFAFSSAEVNKVDKTLVDKVKSLEEYSTYKYCVVFKFGWDKSDCVPNWNVCFFNDVADLKLYITYWNGWPTIRSNKDFNFISYILDLNSYEVQYRSESSGILTSHILYSNSICYLDGNYPVYTDNSFSDFFFQPEVVLLEKMTVQEIPDKIRQILIILVPIGLMIFGMLLSLYLVSSKKWLMR